MRRMNRWTRGWWPFLISGLIGLLLFPNPLLQPSLHAAASTTYSIVENYDIDSATLTFCRLQPDPIQGLGLITTAGSNTVVTGASGTPFAGLGENDALYGLSAATGAVETRYITTWTSNTSVTVNAAVDWSSPATGINFSYKHLLCGTTANDGWFDMAPFIYASITVNVQQINTTTGVDFRWECKNGAPGAAPVQVCPTTINTFRTVTVAGITDGSVNCAVEEPYSQCRVGMKLNTTDDGGDLTTNREQIFISYQARSIP